MKTNRVSSPKAKSFDSLAYNRLISLVNSMADGVIAVDKHIKVVLFNAAALNILDRNNLKEGDRLDDVFRPLDKYGQPVDTISLIEGTTIPSINRDFRLAYADGSTSNIYLSIAPVHLGYGRIGQEGYVLLLRDITTEKSLEEERDEFTSVVSHELRTPITIAEGNISNALLIMQKNGNLDAINKALGEAHHQILYLSDIINDLATLSRAERGKLTLEIQPINVHELILELAENYSGEVGNRGLELKVDIDPKLELLYSSELYVREILQNFITNALKYTPKGQIRIHAVQKPDGIEIAVTDTGIGISKADQERIFEKFFRSEDSRAHHATGTGLGLYVTLKLAKLTNAKIKFTSELNKGSTFSVYFPSFSDHSAPPAA